MDKTRTNQPKKKRKLKNNEKKITIILFIMSMTFFVMIISRIWWRQIKWNIGRLKNSSQNIRLFFLIGSIIGFFSQFLFFITVYKSIVAWIYNQHLFLICCTMFRSMTQKHSLTQSDRKNLSLSLYFSLRVNVKGYFESKRKKKSTHSFIWFPYEWWGNKDLQIIECFFFLGILFEKPKKRC